MSSQSESASGISARDHGEGDPSATGSRTDHVAPQTEMNGQVSNTVPETSAPPPTATSPPPAAYASLHSGADWRALLH